MIHLPSKYKYTWESFQGKLRWSFVLLATMLFLLISLLIVPIDATLKENAYHQDTIIPIKEQAYILSSSVSKANMLVNRYLLSNSFDEKQTAFFELDVSGKNALDSLKNLGERLRETEGALLRDIGDIEENFLKIQVSFEQLDKLDKQEDREVLVLKTIPADLYFFEEYLSVLIKRIQDLEQLKRVGSIWQLEEMMMHDLRIVFFIVFLALFVFGSAIGLNTFLVNHFLYQANKIYDYAHALSIGHLSKTHASQKDEFGAVLHELNAVNQELSNVKAFAQDVGEEKFDTEIAVFSNSDDLGEALEGMRKSLREIHDKEELRTWQLNGINSLADVIRTSTREIESFCDTFLYHLIEYSKLNQGAIYLYNKDKNALEMKACFAYGRKKHLSSQIELGHGVVGEVFRDGDTVVMTDIPDNYIKIRTGLGEALPKSLAVVPLKYQEEKLGVIELAAFHRFSEIEIELFEQISEIFTANLLNAINTNRTEELLREATEATHKLNAQEEELRQNAEELLAMREGLERRNLLLEEELELFKALVRNNEIPVVQTDYYGNILTSSGAFLRLLKDVEGDIHNVNIMDVMPSLSTTYNKTDAITANTFLQTHRLKLKTGEFMDVRTAINRAKVHGITRFSITILNHVDQGFYTKAED